jgi:hypothetical protein
MTDDFAAHVAAGVGAEVFPSHRPVGADQAINKGVDAQLAGADFGVAQGNA